MEKSKSQLLIDAISIENEGNVRSLNETLSILTDEEKRELENYLEYYSSRGLSIEFMASCYNVIAKDTLEEQTYFMKNKKYRHSSYAEVQDSVYLNKEYMEKYMYGLMLTGFLWENHVVMNRWYEEKIPKDMSGGYLEIGPGHGYHMMTAMRKCSFGLYDGVDISPTSVAMTQAVISHFFPERTDRVRIYEADFTEHFFDRKYDAVVMGEVLEHVEQPVALLRKIAETAKDDAFIYITTAINAAAVDHIFLFDSPESVAAVVREAGLSICDQLVVPYRGTKLEKSLHLRLPVSIAMVLR